MHKLIKHIYYTYQIKQLIKAHAHVIVHENKKLIFT